MLSLLLSTQVLQVGAAEVLEAGRIELPVLALDPVEIAAEKVELQVDGTDSLHLVEDLLRLLDDILCLLQLVVLVWFHFTNEHHGQDVGLFVHLGLILDFLNKCDGLSSVSKPVKCGSEFS